MKFISEESFGIIPLRHEGEQWFIFIILHKHGNHWGFPKGKAEDSEHPLESAKRELEEETGLIVEKLLQEEPITEYYTFYLENRKVEKTVHYYPAIVSGALLLQPEEIRDGKWLSFEKAQEQLTFNEAKKLCQKIQELVSV
jgi:8-oxo-dGTP pyrophosphatase MutT (NUDIX family)